MHTDGFCFFDEEQISVVALLVSSDSVWVTPSFSPVTPEASLGANFDFAAEDSFLSLALLSRLRGFYVFSSARFSVVLFPPAAFFVG